jgi:hypothetical protein
VAGAVALVAALFVCAELNIGNNADAMSENVRVRLDIREASWWIIFSP